MAKKEMSFHIHKASIDDRIEQPHDNPGEKKTKNLTYNQ